MMPNIKLGAEPKKVLALVGLLLIAAVIYFRGSSDTGAPVSATPAAKTQAPARPGIKQVIEQSTRVEAEAETTKAPAPAAGKAAARDFRPSMKHNASASTDPERFDPTLRTDVLKKLADVRIERVDRSLFDFNGGGPAPSTGPKLPEPKIVVRKAPARMIGPEPPPPPPPAPGPVVTPPPPPIPLKFYGRALPMRGGVKRVFLLQNEEVAVLTEGEIYQKRYKIVSISATSVVVEDIDFHHRQAVRIEEPPSGF